MTRRPRDPSTRARERGARDAESALESGDHDYHRHTKGLSTRTLIADYWSFAVDEVVGSAVLDKRAVAALFAEYKRAWQAVVAEALHPTPPTTWTVDDGRLDLQPLGKIPSDIRGLTTVRSLSLYGMRLARLDPVLFTLPNVETAYLQRNKLTSIPAGLGKWKKLTALHLGENPIASADEIGALTSLRALDLSCIKFKQLPASIGELHDLEALDLFQPEASWKELPPSFAALRRLRVICVPLDRPAAVRSFFRAAKLRVKVVTGGAVMP